MAFFGENALADRIDLTREMQVAYWCRIFDVSEAELRNAVKHAGHQIPEVRRYLNQKAAAGGTGGGRA
jgi:hypothetical protein